MRKEEKALKEKQKKQRAIAKKNMERNRDKAHQEDCMQNHFGELIT